MNQWRVENGMFIWQQEGRNVVSGYAVAVLKDGESIDTRKAEMADRTQESFRDSIGQGTCMVITYRTDSGL